ncbi:MULTISPECIES: ribosome maturation factor RimM [unclassified Kitasatospora]|uniref:ribosome maturation factor RimM n=1 Tax=unclassified Kitasatospora TaxID=2633591 RepID=UPI00070C5E46|nr:MULTISPECIES: ribosome maturation factor RimM [unclassified Kitasatospora]KQV17829.1 16S rRNA processing protein RimM [Kitasatospora sp. Root107]KRB70904.1 16S rRNA processing protein RimM [Kitasatospora sp. Root187]
MQLVVGKIGRAHGIRGDVSVEVRTDEPELRLGPGAVLLTDPATVGPLTIESGKVHSGRLLLRFAGVNDRNAAEALRGTMLIAEIDPEDRPDDPEEFYDHQLIGLDVVLLDGTLVGELSEVVHLPYQDLLTVTRPDGTEVLVPFVTRIVPTIDLENQRAVIDPPPGLIDPAEAVVVRSDDADDADDVAGSEGAAGTAADDASDEGGARG